MTSPHSQPTENSLPICLGLSEVHTVRQMGWSSLKNGDLLERASGRFDAMLTA